MPEYLAPGVYVEEVSFTPLAIEGVSTTTTAFIGPTRTGPTEGPLQVLTSLSDFEQIYGDGQQLSFGDAGLMTNFMWQATNAFFAQGGQRLYVQRVFLPSGGEPGAASGTFDGAPAGGPALTVTSKWPGAASAAPTSITVTLGQNVLSASSSGAVTVNGLLDLDIVWINRSSVSPPQVGYFQASLNTSSGADVWTFNPPAESPPVTALELSELNFSPNPSLSDQVRVVTATVTVQPTTAGALPLIWSGLPLDPNHTTYGAPDSLFAVFNANPGDSQLATTVPVVIAAAPAPSAPINSGLDVLTALGNPALDPVSTPTSDASVAQINTAGSDGDRPTFDKYQGISANPDDKSGLNAFVDIDEISIIAAPGSTYAYERGWMNEAAAINQLLIEHVEAMAYRVAVLDSGDGQDMSSVQAMRATLDSDHAAFYYPWVQVLDPISQQEIILPPSGFVAGIYAETDIERGVWKAPANVVVNGALGFEKVINKPQQEVLNPLGINCFRFFEDRGYRLWGARTISSDSQWKYINVRRYFCYLEHSIDKATQWVVFEPNGEQTWSNVTTSVSDFLFSEFQSGALAGDKPADAYFVRCDPTTMTQNDIDNGRLICLVGVAPLYPAEFVIFRIGQWTASASSS